MNFPGFLFLQVLDEYDEQTDVADRLRIRVISLSAFYLDFRFWKFFQLMHIQALFLEPSCDNSISWGLIKKNEVKNVTRLLNFIRNSF